MLNFSSHKPSKALEQYVKCFYTLEHKEGVVTEDYAFATGCVEVMFTLDGNPWQVKSGNAYRKTSQTEVWGQVLAPLPFKATGKSTVFGIWFYPATASLFLVDDISSFNDKVFNLADIGGSSITELHSKLQEAKSVKDRIEIVEAYLLNKLHNRSKLINKIDLVQRVMNEVTHKDFFDNIGNVAERYGITSRYLQKIFVQYTGLTPKLYMKIHRFQRSLVLIGKKETSLTSIAHAAGYFDQSHFIREYKSFTGFLPSTFNPNSTTAILASPINKE